MMKAEIGMQMQIQLKQCLKKSEKKTPNVLAAKMMIMKKTTTMMITAKMMTTMTSITATMTAQLL